MKRGFLSLAIATLILGSATVSRSYSQTSTPSAPQWQWPDKMKNAKVLRKSTGGDELRGIMRGFTSALHVRCTFCHVGTEQMSLSDIDFASDANPRKEVARSMVRLMQHLNERDLPAIKGLDRPKVTCYTCHRGATEPALAPAPAPTTTPAS